MSAMKSVKEMLDLGEAKAKLGIQQLQSQGDTIKTKGPFSTSLIRLFNVLNPLNLDLQLK